MVKLNIYNQPIQLLNFAKMEAFVFSKQ